MRSYNVLLLIALVAISSSNAFEFTNLAEVKELRSNSYGNSLIETISLTLQNAGSINDVQKLLDDLLYKLNKNQEESDKAWEAEEKRLKAKIAKLIDEISVLDHQIVLDKAEKKSYEVKRDTAIANLKQYNQQLVNNAASLKSNAESRRKDIAEHARSVSEHNDIINAIESVIKSLKKLRGSVSGVGKPSHVNQTAAEKRDEAYAASEAEVAKAAARKAKTATKLKKSFVQLTQDETEAMIFVEMATSADQAALSKLIKLLRQLSNSTKKSLNDDEEHEAKSLSTFNTLAAALNEDTVKLNAMVKDQQKRLENYVDKISKLKAKIHEEEIIVASKRKELASTIKERDDKETQYKADKEERNRERKIIKRLQKIVNERLANMTKFLKDQK